MKVIITFLLLNITSGCSLVHEASHALAYPQGVTGFRPYPHYEGKQFVCGYTEFNHGVPQDKEFQILAAPYVVDTFLFTTTDAILSNTKGPRWARLTAIGLGMLVPLADFAGNLYSPANNSDFRLMYDHGYVNEKTMVTVGTVMVSIGLARALWQIYNEFR
jgi:hypothetical protein